MNHNFINTIVFVILLFFLYPNIIFAQSNETIYASYKYTLGDSDTKSDAKKIAFIEAKRLCLEKAGSYIESNTEVLNFRLSKDEIKTYTGGILKVEIVSEEFKAVGENLTLYMVVKSEIVLNDVRDNFKRVREDKIFASTIRKQEMQLQELENKIRKLQQNLSSNDFNKTSNIRKERKAVFDKIDELEKIKSEIESKTNLAIENIVVGMTPQEVISIVGDPRSKDFYNNFNYGDVWVIFENGIVRCLVTAQSFGSGEKKCSWYDGIKIK